MRSLSRLTPVLALAAVVLAAAPSHAGSVEKSVTFKLGEWITLDSNDGPTTLHRIRVAEHSGGVTKSLLSRPGNAEYLQDIQIQLEYSNGATRDWEARMRIEWLDGDGKVIDGYNDSENLDSESRNDEQTVTLSTLKYGLERAKKLAIHIDYDAD